MVWKLKKKKLFELIINEMKYNVYGKLSVNYR